MNYNRKSFPANALINLGDSNLLEGYLFLGAALDQGILRGNACVHTLNLHWLA